jgi:hypothetical protein
MSREENVETQPITQQEQVTQETPQAIEPNQDETPKQEVPAVIEEKKSSESVTPSIEKDQEESKVPQAHNGLKADEEPKGRAPLDIFDPTQEGETANKANPEAKISEAPLSKSSIVVEVDNSNKKFNFHYQFKNGKLYLFGTFEKNLYEIMEFFSGNKRTVFLFYKDNYYLLSEENDTIKPLAPINDPTLLQKLKDYRGAR